MSTKSLKSHAKITLIIKPVVQAEHFLLHIFFASNAVLYLIRLACVERKIYFNPIMGFLFPPYTIKLPTCSSTQMLLVCLTQPIFKVSNRTVQRTNISLLDSYGTLRAIVKYDLRYIFSDAIL